MLSLIHIYKPTIAFQESTQQFYDSKGNVRVQIGMDGKGDFNFIVKNGDRAALFDENGITPVSYTHLDVYKRQEVTW